MLDGQSLDMQDRRQAGEEMLHQGCIEPDKPKPKMEIMLWDCFAGCRKGIIIDLEGDLDLE